MQELDAFFSEASADPAPEIPGCLEQHADKLPAGGEASHRLNLPVDSQKRWDLLHEAGYPEDVDGGDACRNQPGKDAQGGVQGGAYAKPEI